MRRETQGEKGRGEYRRIGGKREGNGEREEEKEQEKEEEGGGGNGEGRERRRRRKYHSRSHFLAPALTRSVGVTL